MKKIILLSGVALILIAGVTVAFFYKKTKSFSPESDTGFEAGDLKISVFYNRPFKKGRVIFGGLVPYGKTWRTGANEATVFETDKAITVQGKKLPAGKYGLFTIFNGNDVTVIFSKTWNQWGAFKYNEADDQLRIKTKATDEKSSSEKMIFKISPAGVVTLLWGPKKVDLVMNY